MELVNMKMRKKSTGIGMPETVATKEPADQYPYNLKVRFETEQVNKIPGMREMETGTKVRIIGTGVITSKSEDKRQGGEDRISVEIQVENVAVKASRDLEKVSMKEFVDSRNKRRKDDDE
jgi:hypothetical protein